MGLDSVELVIRVEETFGISLPDEEASRIMTVGQLYWAIVPKLRQERSQRCLTARAFHRLRQGMVNVFQVDRSSVRPATLLDNAMVAQRRRTLWPTLSRAMRLKLPDLHRPGWLVRTLGLVIALFVGLGYVSMKYWNLPSPVLYVGLVLACIVLAVVGTRPHARELWHCRTVGDLSRAVLRDNFLVISAEVASVNEKEVWTSLLALIADQIGVPESKLNADTRFVDDLNMD